MLQYIVIVYLLRQIEYSNANAIGNEVESEHELVLAFVVHRHGERTPDEDELSLSSVKEKIVNLTLIEGSEGLTNVGKRRAYQIGKFIKQRYGNQGLNLISNLYLKDEILVRSTDKERTKMTAQLVMAAVYPPEIEQQWDEGIGKVWQPVPYIAIPLSEDYLRFYQNCVKYKNLMAKAKQDSIHEEFAPYSDLIKKIKHEIGRNFTENPLLFQTLLDLFRSQVALGLGLPDWAHSLLPDIGEAARLAYGLYFRTDEMKKLAGGVMLNDFIQAAHDIAANKEVKKRLRIYSAHDFNLGALIEITRTLGIEKGIPEYGSLYALELYKSKRTQGFSVMPVYLPQAGVSAAVQLHFEGCETGNYCDFYKFNEMIGRYLLPERIFYSQCGIKTEL